MTYDDAADALDSLGWDWAVGGFSKSTPRLPYIDLEPDETRWIHRDDLSALRVDEWRAELYTSGPGPAECAGLANALTAAGIAFEQEPAGRVGETSVFLNYFYFSTIN